MNIREDRVDAIRKVAPLNERLERQYGVSIDMASDVPNLQRIFEHYYAKRKMILALEGESGAFHDSDYAKAVLITETIRLFLREIAPKRTKRKKS